MGLRDLLGRGDHGGSKLSVDDVRTVADYRRFLSEAPRDTIEQAHVEAFEKLTPEQFDAVYRRFVDSVPLDDVPTDRRPDSLARSAVQAEERDPGFLGRTFGVRDPLLSAIVWYSVVDTAACIAFTTAAWTVVGDPGDSLQAHVDDASWGLLF